MNTNYKISNISLEVFKLFYALSASTDINHLAETSIEIKSSYGGGIKKYEILAPYTNSDLSLKIKELLGQSLSSGDRLLLCLNYLADQFYLDFDESKDSGGVFIHNIRLTSRGINLIEGAIDNNTDAVEEVKNKFTFINFDLSFDRIFGFDFKGLDLSNLISIGNTN